MEREINVDENDVFRLLDSLISDDIIDAKSEITIKDYASHYGTDRRSTWDVLNRKLAAGILCYRWARSSNSNRRIKAFSSLDIAKKYLTNNPVTTRKYYGMRDEREYLVVVD